ncbi:MAG: hypothetical protein LBC94_01935 [Desulfovibrio sp.]|jgi:tetratricopeptide (TPR) repeat protein|nr:hypothetical protein [Desulfovibrio sp.]
MVEKIGWYKEVLELEPNSKVFFPLARLLNAENRRDEAIDVLEQGLGRHPEFLEARLLFVELLHKAGRRAICAEQINKISALFSGYPEFWQAWAACLAAANASSDMPTILRFVAAHFTHPSLSLHEILDQGIASILGQTKTYSATPGEELSAATGRDDGIALQPAVVDHFEKAPQEAGFSAAPAVFNPPAGEDEPPDREEEDEQNSGDNAESEERFSLRTRSMAEVLAEQGDIHGALDIYQELAAASTEAGEKADLLQRIATLNAKLVAASETTDPQAASGIESAVGKDKLISMLEALAERVEARAHG